MEKREKEPIFTEMQFENQDSAKEIKSTSEKKLAQVKLGLLIAFIAEIAWGLVCFAKMPDLLSNIICSIAIIITVASYILGGGLGAAFKFTCKIAKAIGWFGWFCVPFPVDIFTGIMLSVMAILIIPISFIFIPLFVVFCNYIQINKNYKAAVSYLS